MRYCEVKSFSDFMDAWDYVYDMYTMYVDNQDMELLESDVLLIGNMYRASVMFVNRQGDLFDES